MSRFASALVLLCALAGCSVDHSSASGSATAADSGKHTDAGTSASKADAGSQDTHKLEKPGTLPRPPKGGLPDDLKPPH